MPDTSERGAPTTWNHSRKGQITGRIVRDNGEWVDIEVTEPGHLRLYSRGWHPRAINPDVEPGDRITVRKAFLSEVPQ